MIAKTDNIFKNIPDASNFEHFTDLLGEPNIRIERIVSKGQATPKGEWLVQNCSEWVMLLKGSAALVFYGDDKEHVMNPGQYILIPPNCRHRVEWTNPDDVSIWLAIHFTNDFGR